MQPTLIIHDAIQACIAAECMAELGVIGRIETPYDMADALGPMWARQLLDLHPNLQNRLIYHCGNALGNVQAAISLQLPNLRLEPDPKTQPRAILAIQYIAQHADCVLWIGPPTSPVLRLPPPHGPCNAEQLRIVIKEWLVSLTD